MDYDLNFVTLLTTLAYAINLFVFRVTLIISSILETKLCRIREAFYSKDFKLLLRSMYS
jgi:hypothetical protein